MTATLSESFVQQVCYCDGRTLKRFLERHQEHPEEISTELEFKVCFKCWWGIGVQAVKEEEHANSTGPTGAVEKKKHRSTHHVLRKWRTRSAKTQSVETMTEMPHRTIEGSWTSAETKGTGQTKFAKVELHRTKVLHQHRCLQSHDKSAHGSFSWPRHICKQRACLLMPSCVSPRKNVWAMMQTKIRPKTIAKQLQNTKVSRFGGCARPVPGS